MPDEKMSVGNVAYIAYGQQVNFRNFQGDEMPLWNELPPQITRAWERAAQAAIEWHDHGITTLSRD